MQTALIVGQFWRIEKITAKSALLSLTILYVTYIIVKTEKTSLVKMYLHEIYKSFFRILFTPLWNCACFEFPGTEAISHYRVPFAKKIGLITIRKHQGIFILCSQASQINNGLKTFIKSYFYLYIYIFLLSDFCTTLAPICRERNDIWWIM